jgi:hypothetical protein
MKRQIRCFTIAACIVATVFFLLSIQPSALGQSTNETEALILDAAESLFVSMKKTNLPVIWGLLTEKSQKTIANDVYKYVKAPEAGGHSYENINKDFQEGGPLAQSYWKAFLGNFNPDMVLEQSRWEMGQIKKDKAEVLITFYKSARPAVLKMSLEQGKWRVGLVETFWGRK